MESQRGADRQRRTGDFAGGLIVRNGAVEVNNTLELLIDLCRGDMAAEVAKILFG